MSTPNYFTGINNVVALEAVELVAASCELALMQTFLLVAEGSWLTISPRNTHTALYLLTTDLVFECSNEEQQNLLLIC